MRVELRSGEIIKVFGPMAIVVEKGLLYILGKRIGSNTRIIVPRTKSYPILSLEDSVLEVTMGDEAVIQDAEKDEPLREWMELAEELRDTPGTVMVIGSIDSGKTSIATMLANEYCSAGHKTCVIDLDIGQADIGPPGFISLSPVDHPVLSLRELSPAAMRFIGDIRPQYTSYRIMLEARRLLEYARRGLGCSAIVIDTDGWLRDTAAFSYKSRLIEELAPEKIIAVGQESHGFFRRYEKSNVSVYEVRAPRVLRTRSREMRRMLRSNKYMEFLDEAPLRTVSMDDVLMLYMTVFDAEELDPRAASEVAGAEILYASRTPDTLYVVTNEQVREVEKLKEWAGVQRIRFMKPGFEKRIYVAVSSGGVEEYPGLIEGIDYGERKIRLRTRWEKPVKVIKFSRIKLTEDYTEQLIE